MRFITWLLEPFFSNGKEETAPVSVEFRRHGGRAAIVFIHGFYGDTRSTWAGFTEFILQEPRLSRWDVFGLGFPTSLRIDVPAIWSADPDLSLIALGLRTTLSLPPFNAYEVLAIASHSMGGLVAQRAVLDDPDLAGRVSNLFLFGTPSRGLPKVRLFSRLKRQLRDMLPSSKFIRALRNDWQEKYGDSPPFDVRVVAGDRDEFVPASSSLDPFQEKFLAVVPGNHLEIVKPLQAGHQSVQIIIESLTGGRRALPLIDGARLAVELGQFKKAVSTLLPRAAELDDNAVVSLALALEGTGRSDEALNILETYYKGGMSSTDALGTLAGRLKRRWITARTAADLSRAIALYATGLEQAEAKGDAAQAYYHAINVAFLCLMRLPPHSEISSECRDMARRALEYCSKSPVTNWRSATEGEAWLLLGELEKAVICYTEAINQTQSPREIDSMHSQAFRVAERIYGELGLSKIQETFGFKNT